MSLHATTSTMQDFVHSGTASVAGGRFRMGSENFYPEERPVREVTVDGFWID